jgi:glyoxalase/bleomycin resistance protein/dioxygenase superfamily protein
MAETSIPAETRIGHVHLKVADLERAIGFYRDYLGFDLLFTFESAAFLSAGGYHHHIGLNTWESKDGSPPVSGTTGLYHFAINYPTWHPISPWRSNACLTMLGQSTGHPITAPTKPSTCTIPISTGSNWPGTGTPASGRAGTGWSRSVDSRLTSPACSPSLGSPTRKDTWQFCQPTSSLCSTQVTRLYLRCCRPTSSSCVH